ncbi:hypothetical protein V6N13_073969 [Hibiscus sabdariffa]|uniref:Uncharacterized protein n=1 Tax=Hibiscus sabdariffa TaxID=183260 RepID=A0ABR2U7X3_9ROSI
MQSSTLPPFHTCKLVCGSLPLSLSFFLFLCQPPSSTLFLSKPKIEKLGLQGIDPGLKHSAVNKDDRAQPSHELIAKRAVSKSISEG